MKENSNIVIGGPAGAGIKTVGQLLAKLLMRSGRNVFGYSEYPSLIRGGHNSEHLFAGDGVACSQIKKINILLAMDDKTVEVHKDNLDRDAIVVGEPRKNSRKTEYKYLPIPMKKIAKNSGAVIMANNAGVGAVMNLLGIDLNVGVKMMEEIFSGKKKIIIEANKRVLREGFALAGKYLKGKKRIFSKADIKKRSKKQKNILLTGNEAVGLGAIAAGIGLYAAYPMTPSTSVLHLMIKYQHEFGYVVRQPEDEIAAVNMVIGSMHAGVRSMCATSGGGFALMNESLALSGMTETPLVILVVQRPGPATGLPTWTEQGDLKYIINAGHGEFPRIVLAPGDMAEAFEMTIDAFNLAERYQTPVIILTDKYLAESYMSTGMLNLSRVEVERGKVITPRELSKRKNFQRYALTDDGVSIRSLPGMKGGIYLANSDEHGYHGLVDESSEMRIWQNEKRLRKGKYVSENLPGPVIIGPRKADVTLITWGSSKLPARQAISQVKSQINILHFSYLWPLNKVSILKSLEMAGKKTLLIEGNVTGQFQAILKEITGFEPTDYLRRGDGRPFYPSQLIEKVGRL